MGKYEFMNNNKFFLTDRQMIMAKEILEKEEFTVMEIIKETGIPRNAFYYEISIIKEFFKDNGIDILKIEKNKYKVVSTNNKLRDFKNKLYRKEDVVLISNSKERNNYIILLLLCLSEPVMIKDIVTRFKISKPTAIKSFQNAKEFLESEHLTVYSRPNYGSYVSGNEIFIRSAFNDVITGNYLNEAVSYLNDISNGILTRKASNIENFIFDFLSVDLIKKCIKAIDIYEKDADVKFGDVVRLSTVLLFAFTIKRINQNKFVEVQEETQLDIKEYENYEKMYRCIEYFGESVNTNIPDNEKAYLMIILMNGKSMQEGNFERNPSHFEFCEKITKAIVEEAAIYLGPNMLHDEILYKNLFNHLMAVIYRCKNKMPIKNQLLSEIQDSYPYTYFVADRCRGIIKDMIGCEVPVDEIGYLTLYFEISQKQIDKKSREIRAVVVCVEGLVTAWLIAASISKYFPEVNIVKVLSIYDYQKSFDDKDVDLIITTSKNIVNKDNKKVLLVNPILSEKDLEELSNYVTKRAYMNDFKQTSSNSNRGILNYLGNDCIQINQVVAGWKDAVDKASYPLLKKGIINEEYVQSIKYNIIKYGPYVVSLPGIAILHSNPNIPGIRLGISLTTLAIPVKFGKEENDPVSIIFTLSSPDTNSHMQILEDLVELFQNNSFFSKIVKSKDSNEIRKVISDILNDN